MVEPPKGHWLAQLNVEKDIHYKLPDFQLCGCYGKEAYVCCQTMRACKLDPKRSLCSGRCGNVCFDCRNCCDTSLVHCCDCYSLFAQCACFEWANATKFHLPNCNKKIVDVKGQADDAFGGDSAGKMPPFETLCFKTSCCCCSQGLICDKSCCGYVYREECLCCARGSCFGVLKPEKLLCSRQAMCMILDCAPGSPCTPLQYKDRGKLLFCCDVGSMCGACDAGCGGIACCKAVGHCLCQDFRVALPCDKKEVPCIIALCGVVCYPKCHLDCCKSAADKRVLYDLASEEAPRVITPPPPKQAMKRDFA